MLLYLPPEDQLLQVAVIEGEFPDGSDIPEIERADEDEADEEGQEEFHYSFGSSSKVSTVIVVSSLPTLGRTALY